MRQYGAVGNSSSLEAVAVSPSSGFYPQDKAATMTTGANIVASIDNIDG